MSAGYPAHWEADVVLADGGTAHLRPIVAEDADGLIALHDRTSEETRRLRFFAYHPHLTEAEVEHFTHVDYDRRVALVLVLSGDMVAVGGFDRTPDSDVAEVAFLVDDAHQGRGLGSVLLEHLAAIAAERGIGRFEAEVLAENSRMVRVFRQAGYQASRAYEQDVVHLVFPIEPTAASLAVQQSREQRSEARSIGRLLAPRSVAVIGASRDRAGAGHIVLANLLRGDFQGPVYPINPNAEHVGGVRAYPSVLDVPGDVDLAVLAVQASAVAGVVDQCARKGVRGLVVLAGGYRESGPAGRAAERALVATARANGMRVIGPQCLGIMSTAPQVSLNASLAPALPRRGRAGFFCQSGALGVAVLSAVNSRGLGLSTFVSAGNRADVSGNDLLQYWQDDPDTDLVLLYLESFGNPRKFARLARRVGRHKPIVAVKSRGSVAARQRHDEVPEHAVDALYRQSGVIRVDTLSQLFDVAALLTSQPLPAGPRVAVVGNSGALGQLAADACLGAGLVLEPLSPAAEAGLTADLGSDFVVANPLILPVGSDAGLMRRALETVLADPAVDAVVTVFVPLVGLPASEVAHVLGAGAAGKPMVSTFVVLDTQEGATEPPPAAGAVPTYPSPEDAVSALAATVAYAQWRRRPQGPVPALDDVDVEAARRLVTQALRAAPDGVDLAPEQVAALLAAYGVHVWPSRPVASVDEAVAAGAALGYPVALKATAPALRHRPDLGNVDLDIASEAEIRAAYDAMDRRLGGTDAELALQRMAPAGVATVLRTAEDPSFGTLMSFGVGGVATDLLGDRAFRIIPLTGSDAADLVRSVRAAPLLFGYRGSEPVDVAALEELVLRVARLADDLPEVAELELNPVVAAAAGVSVLGAAARLWPPTTRLDAGPRRLG